MRHCVYILTAQEQSVFKIGYTYGRLSQRRTAARNRCKDWDINFWAVVPDSTQKIESKALLLASFMLRYAGRSRFPSDHFRYGGDWFPGSPQFAHWCIIQALVDEEVQAGYFDPYPDGPDLVYSDHEEMERYALEWCRAVHQKHLQKPYQINRNGACFDMSMVAYKFFEIIR